MAHLAVNGELVRGDMILSLILRSDLTPIPQTIEAVVRYDERYAEGLKEGGVLTAGQDNAEYIIVKSVPAFSKDAEQAGKPLAAIAVTGLLSSVHRIGFRLASAVVKEGASLGAIYRACGATARVESDFRAARFSCFVGDYPSAQIAQLLQEEGGGIYWTGNALRFARLGDLVQQKATIEVPAEATTTVESGFLERHSVPWFYSTDESGAFVLGNRERPRAAMYAPRRDARVLRNMTRCLVLRHTLRSIYRPDINAGAAAKVGDETCAIVTAAHVYSAGADGSPATTFSKFWLGSVEE